MVSCPARTGIGTSVAITDLVKQVLESQILSEWRYQNVRLAK